MSEITPASSQNPNPDVVIASSYKNSTDTDLAPVSFYPSHKLWIIEAGIYSVMWLSASIALLPFFLSAIYWPICWILFSVLIAKSIRNAFHKKNGSCKTLSSQNHIWHLQGGDGDSVVSPFADILLWNNIIVLPIQYEHTGHKQYLILAVDSMRENDWRRLRVWLRTCLHLSGETKSG